jgi:hypothetical protein
MNERIIKLGLESGMLNYVEHETPRHYFLCGNADEECLEKFAELIVRECAGIIEEYGLSLIGRDENYLGETLNLSIKVQEAGNKIKQHFGIEE